MRNRRLNCIIVVITLFLSPLVIKAGESYLFGFGGFSWVEDYDPVIPNGGGFFSFDMGDGVIVGGGAGCDLGCYRFEVEVLYSGNEIDQATLTANIPTPIVQRPDDDEFLEIGSDVNYSALMVNLHREIPIPCQCLTGYFGAGIGVASLEMDTDLNNIKFSDRDSAFAWQFIAGVEYEINCRLSAFTQYRVLAIEETYLASNGVSFDIDRLFNHSVNIGARLKLK